MDFVQAFFMFIFINKTKYDNIDDFTLVESLLESLDVLEVALNPTQLIKPYNPSHEFHGKYETRGDRFLDMIKKGSPFELNNGEKVVLDPEGSKIATQHLQSREYEKLGKGVKLFKSTDGEIYSLSQFKKTAEFGSGGGTSGGSANTDLQESAQCLVNAVAFNIKKGEITEEDLTDENFQSASNNINTSSDLKSIADFIRENTMWVTSLITTANTLYNEYSSLSVQPHRGSEFVNKIYESYKVVKRQEGLSMQSDKWNPADIWLVSGDVLGIEFPQDTLTNLNNFLKKLFDAKKLIGVSLKKVSDSAKIRVYNDTESSNNLYKYEGYESTSKSNSVSIKYNEGYITFRTFNFATNFSGEIKGKFASHGKIGVGPLNNFLKYRNLPELTVSKVVYSNLKEQNQETLEVFYSRWNQYVDTTSKEEFTENILKQKNLGWQVSKFLALELVSIFESSSNPNDVISDIIGYASSNTDLSSVFVKVSSS